MLSDADRAHFVVMRIVFVHGLQALCSGDTYTIGTQPGEIRNEKGESGRSHRRISTRPFTRTNL